MLLSPVLPPYILLSTPIIKHPEIRIFPLMLETSTKQAPKMHSVPVTTPGHKMEFVLLYTAQNAPVGLANVKIRQMDPSPVPLTVAEASPSKISVSSYLSKSENHRT